MGRRRVVHRHQQNQPWQDRILNKLINSYFVIRLEKTTKTNFSRVSIIFLDREIDRLLESLEISTIESYI